MGLKNFLDTALASFEKDHSEPTFTFGGSQLRCIPSTESSSMPLEVDGFNIQIDLTLLVRKSVLPNKPRQGQKLRFRDIDYRIERVGDPAAGSHWELALKEANQS